MNSFWAHVEDQLTKLKSATTADEVIAILDPPSSGDAFFAGEGGEMAESLYEAGWGSAWYEAEYYWVMRAPNGDKVTYIEGDVCRGDTHC